MISSVGNSYAALIQQHGVTGNARPTTAVFDEVEQIKELTPEEEMAAFKKEFYAELSNIRIHGTLSNVAINISDAAFSRMKDDPEYKADVLRLLKRDLESSYARPCSIIMNVGSSIDEYRATSWAVTADSDFWGQSRDSHFLKRTSEPSDKKNDYAMQSIDKIMENILAYRLQMEKIDRESLENRTQMARLEQLIQMQKAEFLYGA